MSSLPALEQAQQAMEAYLADLRALVNIDSGTYTPQGVKRVGAYLAERLQHWGFTTCFVEQADYGHHLLATRQGCQPGGPRVLLLGHMDTVFPEGEAGRRPFAVSERDGVRIATGPGVLDMKSGLLIGMYAVHLLAEVGDDEYGQVTFLCNSDEEVGSPSSKGLVRELAGQHDAVLVFEPGRQRQRVVSARKCNGHYTLKVWGRAAHAGVEPHLGRSAILELAHQIQQLHALNGTIAGVTVNVGIVRGGERTNIVADYASCEIDVRAADLAGITAIEEAMHAVTTQHAVEDTRVELSGSMGSYPFERSTRNLPLLALARTAGAELGIAIEDVASGGASDANHAVPAGTPVLDGLGASGGLAHNPDEYIELDYLPERIALVMGLLKRIHTLSGA